MWRQASLPAVEGRRPVARRKRSHFHSRRILLQLFFRPRISAGRDAAALQLAGRPPLLLPNLVSGYRVPGNNIGHSVIFPLRPGDFQFGHFESIPIDI